MQGEVGPGYKQTEVGVIPDDWEVSALGSLVSETAPIRYGVVQIGPDVSGGVPIVPIKYLKGIATSVLHRSAREIEGRFAGSRVRGSDVLISVKGTVGRVGVVPDGFEGNIAREIARVRLRSGVEPLFVAFQLESGHTQQRINEAVVGTTRLEFSIAAVRQFEIALPSSQAEQRAIAAALADADALIAALEGMIAKKRDLKQAAMQHLLTGKTRLPGFSGEWEVKQLGELIASIGDGGTPATKNPEYFGGDIPWVVIDDIQSEIWKTQTSISELGLSRCSAKLWPAGTLILSTGATIGEVGIAKVALATKQGICGIVFQPKKAVADFMKYWFAANRSLLMAKAQGSTIFEVRPPTLAKIEGSFPAVEEQTAIAEVLSDMDADLAALETQAAKARAVKQGMVQELLTGRVRLV